MGIEPRILHGDKRILQILGHSRQTDADAVLDALIFRNQTIIRVINKRGLRLIVQRRQIQRRGSLYVALGDAQHRTHARQTRQHDQQHNNAHHVHRHADGEIRLLGSGLEDAVGMRLLRPHVNIVHVRGPMLVVLRGKLLSVSHIRFFRGISILRRIRVLGWIHISGRIGVLRWVILIRQMCVPQGIHISRRIGVLR